MCLPGKPAARRSTDVKEGIHPKYHEVEVRCACGATWKTHSTKPELHLEICSNCHPFFTGKQKLLDTQGRIDRFNKKYGRGKRSDKAGSEAKAEETMPRFDGGGQAVIEGVMMRSPRSFAVVC